MRWLGPTSFITENGALSENYYEERSVEWYPKPKILLKMSVQVA